MKLHSLGEQLRAARIKKELSLYDVEKISGVEAQFLLAMEMDQLKALPEDIQQEALEKYANSVGLDGKRLFEEQKQNEQKLKKEKKPVERKEDTLAAKAPMSRFLKHKREEKRKSNYLPLLMLSAVSLLIICSVGYIIIRHLSNQPQVIKPNTISTVYSGRARKTGHKKRGFFRISLTLMPDNLFVAACIFSFLVLCRES